MPKLYVTQEEWEAAARKYYTHLTGDRVVVVDWMNYKGCVGTVSLMYTTDQFNHEASPHCRYIVKLDNGGEDDVCSSEIMTQCEWEKVLIEMKE